MRLNYGINKLKKLELLVLLIGIKTFYVLILGKCEMKKGIMRDTKGISGANAVRH